MARMVGETIEIDVGSTTLMLDPERARQLADSIHDAIEGGDDPAGPPTGPSAVTPPESPGLTDDDEDLDEQEAQPVYSSDSIRGGRWLSHPEPPRISEAMRARVRPHADTVRFSVGVLRFMEHTDVDPATVAQVIADPDHRWNMPNPRAQDLSEVAVRDDAPYGAAYYRNTDGVAYVISVRRTADLYADRRSITAGNRSNSQGTRSRKPTIDDLGSLIGFAESAGLRFTRGKRHGKVYDPQAPHRGHVTVPLTPSDSRSWLNCVAQIRRSFEISG